MEVDQLIDTFKNKKVFLTGHTGFKGSWLLKLLNMFGAEVKGYALKPNSDMAMYYSISGDSLCSSVIADIRDAEKLKKEIVSYGPDFVFHLAAQPLVRLSYENPLDSYTTNCIGTANLLDAIRFVTKPCVVVIITTDKVYANMESGKYYTEDDRLGGYDPYSASKACAELVTDSYRNSFFNPRHYDAHQKSVSVARAGNVIGGGDWSKDRIIPDIVKAISGDMPVSIRNPASVRPWQHVLEPVLGYLILADRQFKDPVKFAGAYNFGPTPNDTLPVQQLVQQAIISWGKGDFKNTSSADQPHEAGLLHLSIKKAKEELNWAPVMNSSEAINYTMDWYKTYLRDQPSINTFTDQQIKNYLKKYNGQ